MSATYIFPGGRRLTAYSDGYRVQIGPPLPDGSFVAVAFKHSAVACEGATAEAARIAAEQVIAGWRAAPHQGAA
jgi:hypothetical protein